MTGIIGAIMPVAFNFAAKQWMSCEGQVLPISTNQALFSLLGTTYGGDGRVTFGLPDLRGRTAVGVGQAPDLPPVVLGQKAGVQNVSVLVSQLPTHTHYVTVKGNGLSASSNDPNGNYFGGGGPNVYDAAWDGSSLMNTDCITAASVGGSQPMNIQNPYLGLYYLICTQGIYPSRN